MSLLWNDFVLGAELGSGSWSEVCKAIHKPSNRTFAVKILDKAQLIKRKTTRYASVEKDALSRLSSLNAPGVVRLYAAFQDASSLYFVLDYAPNGDLKNLTFERGSLSLACARFYAAQLTAATLFLHAHGILHRDLKPENMLLDVRMSLKLCDFGSASCSKSAAHAVAHRETVSFVGTAAYIAPEMLLRSEKSCGPSSDIWAIGCVTHFMLYARSPFLAPNDYLSFKKIEALDYTLRADCDPHAKDFMERIFVLDPTKRLGVGPLSSPDALKSHPLFDAIDFDSIWECEVPEIESGVIHPPEADDSDQDALWERFGGFGVKVESGDELEDGR